ncbi:UPF0481 protein [Acorus calamus]|uniref:UPF0481 protein n=1 Tax=Acorus calamus TaxID=4465 RepID=A0AAV9E2I7_ACOCL|nr:UPF0481 protein [Acorus calamus]
MDSLQASSAHHPKLTPHSRENKLKIDLSEINSMEEEMKNNAESNRWRKEPCSIFKVPTFLRWSSLKPYNPKKISYGPYDPRFVSIDPFHRENSQLQDMEEFKWRAVQFLLSKSKEKATLNDCLNKMEELGPRARSCYSKTFKLISDNDWAKMMVLDGCFVLLIPKDNLEDIALLPHPDDEQQPAAASSNENDGAIPPAWPIRKSLLADLLLLENQLPFFVLDELFKLLRSDDDYFDELVDLASYTLLLLYPGTQYFYGPVLRSNSRIHHFLHLFYLTIVSNQSKSSTHDGGLMAKMMNKCWCPNIRRRGIPSVTELEKSGVKFKPNKDAQSILDVTFDFQKGEMKIPPLILYSYTQTTLRNIIAFEQCFGAGCNELTRISDYVILVDFLVGSSADISTLQDKGIVLNWLGSQEEVLTVLKQLRSEIVGTNKDKFADMYNQINMYREIPLNKYRATLCRDYCGDPWIMCSVFAGIVLFVLTAMQTYTAMYSYYHPSPAS